MMTRKNLTPEMMLEFEAKPRRVDLVSKEGALNMAEDFKNLAVDTWTGGGLNGGSPQMRTDTMDAAGGMPEEAGWLAALMGKGSLLKKIAPWLAIGGTMYAGNRLWNEHTASGQFERSNKTNMEMAKWAMERDAQTKAMLVDKNKELYRETMADQEERANRQRQAEMGDAMLYGMMNKSMDRQQNNEQMLMAQLMSAGQVEMPRWGGDPSVVANLFGA